MHWIFAHLIGDFLLQNDWMAKRKKYSWVACWIHVCAYMVPFLFVEMTYATFWAIALQHGIQDRSNLVERFMCFKGSNRFAKSALGRILTDQIIHVLFLAWIMSL